MLGGQNLLRRIGVPLPGQLEGLGHGVRRIGGLGVQGALMGRALGQAVSVHSRAHVAHGVDGFLVGEGIAFKMLDGLFTADESLSIGVNLLKLLLGGGGNVSHF